MAYEDRHPSPGDMLKLLSWVESFPIIPALLIYTRIVSAPCMVARSSTARHKQFRLFSKSITCIIDQLRWMVLCCKAIQAVI